MLYSHGYISIKIEILVSKISVYLFMIRFLVMFGQNCTLGRNKKTWVNTITDT